VVVEEELVLLEVLLQYRIQEVIQLVVLGGAGANNFNSSSLLHHMLVVAVVELYQVQELLED
jgi:hypothetical protein